MKRLIILAIGVICLTFCAADTKTATFGEPCNSTTPCESSSLLLCQNGTCQCKDLETHTFDLHKEICVLKVGAQCRFNFNNRNIQDPIGCVTFAFCDHTYTCGCEPGYFSTPEGTCLPKSGHGQFCAINAHCRQNKNLLCSSNQTCECDSKSSVYEPTTDDCRLKLGATCNYFSVCLKNATCRNPKSSGNGHRSSSDQSVCLCDDLHFQNSDDICVPKRPYGDVCSSNDECKDKDNLICSEGTCKCDNDSLYNSTRNECLLLVNSTCETYSSRPNKCVENARCRHSMRRLGGGGECSCNEGYFQTVKRTCEKFREIDEECSEDILCVSKSPLILSCQNGRCKCSGNSTIYDKEKKVCVKLLGDPCQSDNECVGNTRCSGSKCSCATSLDIPHPSRKYCVSGFSSRCNATVKCDEETGLVCRNGRCECQLMDHKLYDQKTKKCVSLVGGPCDNSSLECVPNSSCVQKGGRVKGVCRCDSGFVPVDRQCDLGYGVQCKQSRYTDWGSKEPRCDRLGPLYCINGTCQCGAYQYYDKEMLRCRGLVGSKCKFSDEQFCVEGALCKGFRATETMGKAGGLCECGDGFLEDEEGRCLSEP